MRSKSKSKSKWHHFEIEVAAPPDRVFEVLTDFASHTRWQTNLTEVEVQPPGPLHVGQRFRKSRDTPGGVMTFEVEITGCDLSERWYEDKVLDSALAGTTAKWQIEDAPAGSNVICDFEMVLGGKLKLFAPMVHSATAKDHAETMLRFKEWAEARQAE